MYETSDPVEADSVSNVPIEAIHDNTLWLREQLGAVDEVSPAEAAHNEGDYIVYDGDLCKVIDDIAIDDPLVEGTNYEVTTIAEELENGGGGGTGGSFLVRITAIAYAGETVTLTDGTNTYTGTLSSLGIAEIIVEQPGAYVATAAGDEIGAVNIGMYSIENDGIFGFIEHMGTEAPSQRVEYIGINEDYNPISITMGGGYNLGDWANYKWLRDNLPYMVKKDGTVDYALNPNDYTEKANGNASDYSNTNYAGAGGFSWADKIYKRVTYSGTDRKVEFCFSPRGGFDPVGFEDKNGNVLQGRWIPMQYPQNVNNEPKTIAGGMPWTGQTTADQVTAVGTIGSKANVLGGPFVETLLDLMIMFATTTDLQDFYGYGACNRGSQQVIAQTVVNGGQFYGTTDKTSYNKIFHSVVLGSYMVWCRDPYELCVSGTLKVSKNYSIDLTGATYTNTGKTYTSTSGWQYPDKYEEVSGYGSVPVQPCGGTTATGGCDGLYVNAGITAVSLRFGSCNYDLSDGPRARDWSDDATAAHWYLSFAVLLDPPVGVRPNAA